MARSDRYNAFSPGAPARCEGLKSNSSTQAYTAAARALPNGQAVTIRVLDLGGDKMIKSGGAVHKEANPFLGNRSIRFLLRNPEIFRRQLRAVLRASSHGNVRIMYPMITAIDELHAGTSVTITPAEGLVVDQYLPGNGGVPFQTRIAADRFGVYGTDVGVMWDNGMVDDPSTPADELMPMTEHRELWPYLASAPSASPELLDWLAGTNDPTVQQYLDARGHGRG